VLGTRHFSTVEIMWMRGRVSALTLALALSAWSHGAAIAAITPCTPRQCAGRPCPALPPGFAGLPCAASAQLSVEIENRSKSAVTAMVDGELEDATATCASGDLAAYPPTPVSCAAGATCSTPIPLLRPGTWIHRLNVQVDGSDAQQQSQRRVIAASQNGVPVNVVHWVVYPVTFVSPVTGGELRDRLDQATALLAAGSATAALVTFDWSAFPGACNPQPISFGKGRTCPTTACGPTDAAYCWTASGLVLDALDRNAEPGGIVLSEADPGNDDLFRISGHGNVIRGIDLSGNPDATVQADTVAFDDAASGNRIEDVFVEGAARGDGVSAECNSRDNLVLRATIRQANDKGVKVTDGGQLLVADSCISGNDNGGIQATRGGGVTAWRNLVQLNLPGANPQDAAQNGIWARGWPLFGPSGIKTPSSVRTDANVVRFNGAQGLAATDDAVARFQNDYVAHNQYAGARVLSTAPCDVVGPDARFDGVAFVCNAATTPGGGPELSGACSTSRLPCRIGSTMCSSSETCRGTAPKGLGLGIGFGSGEFGCCDGACATPPPSACDECGTCTGACRPPLVALGAGRNAFVAQPAVPAPKAGQLIVDPGVPAVPASGNFWGDCTTSGCTPGNVSGLVATAPVATIDSGSPPRIDAVWPHRPARGDLVRIWGTGFDVFDSPGPPGCATAAPPADTCDPSNDTITGTNTVWLRLGGMTVSADVVAVTPTMLAFWMPVDCFDADGGLVVARATASSDEWPLCRVPPDCLGALDGTSCEPDGLPCTNDVCRGGACAHEPAPAGTLCRAAAGECDMPETCDGVSGECPDDRLVPTTVVCRGARDACDAPEHCDGVSAACPQDVLQPAGTTCRPSLGPCDSPGTCTGQSANCPADHLLPAGTICRPSADVCDAPETCTGSDAACPPDIRIAGCTTTTTTTLAPCGDVRCVLAAACPGFSVPVAMQKHLTKAGDLAADLETYRPKTAARRRGRACTLLAHMRAAVTKPSSTRRLKLAPPCARSLGRAIVSARDILHCRAGKP
jgi:hypothetical protein